MWTGGKACSLRHCGGALHPSLALEVEVLAEDHDGNRGLLQSQEALPGLQALLLVAEIA